MSLSASLSTCPAAVEVDATVKNGGSLGVPAGVIVSVYQGAQPGGPLVGTATTRGPPLPGGSEVVSVTVPAVADVTCGKL